MQLGAFFFLAVIGVLLHIWVIGRRSVHTHAQDPTVRQHKDTLMAHQLPLSVL
jgi:hypothetical protein